MATLAKAEKAEIMEKSLKGKFADEERPEGESASERDHDRSQVGKKRSHLDRLQDEAKRDREAIKAQRRREIVREDRMERAGLKKSKTERDNDRDVSEKIALGQAQPTSREAMFDQRLFNQTAGLGSGFKDDEDYHLYDKPLFTDRAAASIYKNIKNVDHSGEADDDQQSHMRKVIGVSGQQSGKDGANEGEEKASRNLGGRAKPVEFEKTQLAPAAHFKGGLQKPEDKGTKSKR